MPNDLSFGSSRPKEISPCNEDKCEMHGPRKGQNGADRSITRGWYISFHPHLFFEIFNWFLTCSFELRIKWNKKWLEFSRNCEICSFDGRQRKKFFFIVEMIGYSKNRNRKDYKIRVILNVIPSTRFYTIHFFHEKIFRILILKMGIMKIKIR